MKIRLIDGSVYDVTRAEVTNGRMEIDIQNKTAEEVRELFCVPANLVNIELLTDTDEKFGDVPGWTALGAVMLVGDTKTAVLSKPVDMTEQRLTAAEADALKAKVIAEELKENGISFENIEVFNASVMVARMNAQALTDAEALKAQAIYSTWEELVFEGYLAEKAGYKFTYKGDLYKTVYERQRFQEDWIPGQGTESIFTRIEEEHTGTLDDPIPAFVNMEYVKGLYYFENGQIYLMNRKGMNDGAGIVLQFLPSALVGQYFTLAM